MRRVGVVAAYSATGSAWQDGPGLVYDRLAEVVVGYCPVPIAGTFALDLGAGTGAATRALGTAGAARVLAVDAALGMLAHDALRRPPAAAGDAMALPFRRGSFDVVVAAFSLNHLTDPAVGLREARRVTHAGGAVVAASYAADDSHPVKAAVDAALRARGWEPEPWYDEIRERAVPRLATAERCADASRAAGLDAEVVALRVPFPELEAAHLVAWRLGMAQHAPFVASLPSDEARAAVAADAVARLGDMWPVLERSILVIVAKVRSGTAT